MSSSLRRIAGIAHEAVSFMPSARQDVERQRAALSHTDHRPWPLPDEPWMLGQTWHDLLFAHWAVDSNALQRVVPAELPLDTFEGAAWIGITPFVVTGFRLHRTPPVPLVSSFPELNVRTYVTLNGKAGIYFLSLDADSRLAVAGARRSHRLPYFRARMTARPTGTHMHYASDRQSSDGPPAELRTAYRRLGDPVTAPSGSLEHWLTERYCCYTLDGNRFPMRADIHHPPWPLCKAEAEIELNTMTAGIGLELSGPPLLHLSVRQDTLLWGLRQA